MDNPYATSAQRAALDDEAAARFLKAVTADEPAIWDATYVWVSAHPAHGVAFARAEAAWALSGRLREVAPRIDPEAIAGPAGRFEAAIGRRHAIAALFAAALIGTAGTVALQMVNSVTRIQTAVGEARRVRLTDGTAVFLNTNTAIEVAMHDDRRFIRLLRGEASFTVAPNAQPVIVEAVDTRISTKAASFNARMRPDVLELTVLNGEVSVSDRKSPGAHRINAVSSAAIRAGAVAHSALSVAQAMRRLSWQSGLVEFRGETLAQAVDEFNRYRAAPLIIGDPEIASIPVRGTFDVDASDGFVRLLALESRIRRVVNADSSVLLISAPSHTTANR